MVKDALNSVFDNIKERTTNPFLGTLIIVWIIHNWKLLYSLFYFDGKLKLDQRLLYIEDYFSRIPFYLNLLYVFLITILVLTVTYVFLGLSRFISDFYEKIVIPKIVKFNDSSAVVLKTEFLAQQEVVRFLESRLEDERQIRISSQNERDDALKKVLELENLNLENKNKGQSSASENATFERVYNNLKKQSETGDVNNIIQAIQNKKIVDTENPVVMTLLQEDFINRDKTTTAVGRYVFTDEGKKFIRHWNNNS